VHTNCISEGGTCSVLIKVRRANHYTTKSIFSLWWH